jgi:hypothetical protein
MSELTDSDIERAQSAMQRAQEAYTAQIERNMRQLVRPDGQPVYGPAEMQEREKAIREAAAATRDPVLQRYEEQAEEVIAEAERVVALLDGADRLASLKPEDAARAGARMAFVAEDAQQPTYKLAPRITAVVAAGDVVEALLFDRYLRRRLETEQQAHDRQSISALLEQLRPLTADPDAAKKRAAAAALKERGRKLRKATWDTTRAEQVEAIQQRMRASGAFSL